MRREFCVKWKKTFSYSGACENTQGSLFISSLVEA